MRTYPMNYPILTEAQSPQKPNEEVIFSYFANHGEATSPGEVDLHHIAEMIAGDEGLKAMTDMVVQAMEVSGGDKKAPAVTQAKAKLPAITASGVVVSRTGAEGFVSNGLVQVDLDGLSKDKIGELKGQLLQDPHAALVFDSPTGTGLKALVAVEGAPKGVDPKAHHKDAFEAVSDYVKMTYGVEMDPAPKNPSSLMYLASDPDVGGQGSNAIPLAVAVDEETREQGRDSASEFRKWATEGGFTGDLRTIDWEELCRAKGLFRRKASADKILIHCPWESEHTTAGGESEAAILLKDGGVGSFRCLHAHCQERDVRDLLEILGAEMVDSYCARKIGDTERTVINGRPAVRLPGDNVPLSEFAKELGAHLRDKGLYARGGMPFIVEGIECVPVCPDRFRTWAEQYVSTVTIRGKGESARQVTLTMTRDTSRSVLNATQFVGQLSRLEYVTPTRVPVMNEEGDLRLLEVGYDEQTGILVSESGEFDPELPLTEAIVFLNEELLAEFPFARDGGRSQSVAIAAMLTVFARGMIDKRSQMPTFLYLGNSEGTGKTTLAKLAGVPAGDLTATSAPTDEAEWSKTLLASVIAGKKMLLIDNVKGRLESAALEAFQTTPTFEGRVLSQSKMFKGDADIVFLITGNNLEFSSDQRRRTLVVQLFSEVLRSEDRHFRRILDEAEMGRLWPKIMASLWALVREWDRAGRPMGSITNSSFPRWAPVFGGILEHAGYTNPCLHAEVEGMGDTDAHDFEILVSAMETGRRYEFREIVEMVIKNGLFERVTMERDGEGLNRKGSSALSKILGRYNRKQATVNARFIADGRGHRRRYYLGRI